MEVETAVNTDFILKVPMISLEKNTKDAIKRKTQAYERLSLELSKLDTRKSTEAFVYSHLVKRMVELSDSIKPLTQRLKYLKVGCGIQEDNLE